MAKLAHSKGTIITCAFGHEVAEFLVDVFHGEQGYCSSVGNWRPGQIPAKKGDTLPLKCKCKSPYFKDSKFPYTKESCTMKKRVYIASPYSQGDKAKNVKVQLDMFDRLMDLGFAPFAPLFFHFAHPRPEKDWLEIDLEWVSACDVVLRLPGESSGADGEVAYANEHHIPVVFSLDELINYH